MKPLLSLVTGTKDRPESFMRLCASVAAHTSVDFEMVVSDATERSLDKLFSLDPRVRILPEEPPVGCTKGFNRAFRECRGEWVIYLNDDAEVCANYDTEAIRFMEAHPQIGLGALHYSEDGSPFHVNEAWKVLYSNFGIIRRSLGESVGWFDESLEMYGCDNSITFRVLLAGYGVADIPGARVIHHSVKDQQRIENQRSRARDNEILQRKYMPLREEWTETFNRLRVDTGTIPWSHGRQPEMAGR